MSLLSLEPLQHGLAVQFSHGERIQVGAIFNKIKKTFPEIDFKKNEHLPQQTILIKYEGSSQRFQFKEMSLYGSLISGVYLTMVSGQDEKKELFFSVDITSHFPQVGELVVGTFKIGEARNISQRFRAKYEVKLNREPTNEDLKRLGILTPKHAVGEMNIKVQHLLLLSYSNDGREPLVMKPSTSSGQPGEDGEYSLTFLTEEEIHQALEERARLLRELRESRTERRNRYAAPRTEVPRGPRGSRGYDPEDDRYNLSPAEGHAPPVQPSQIPQTALGDQVRGLGLRVLNLQQQGLNLGEEIEGDHGLRDDMDRLRTEIERTNDKVDSLRQLEIATLSDKLARIEGQWASERSRLEREVAAAREDFERNRSHIQHLEEEHTQASTRTLALEQENIKMERCQRGLREELREVRNELKKIRKDQEDRERSNQLTLKARLEEVKNVERSIRNREDKLIKALEFVTRIENWQSGAKERHTSTPAQQRNVVEPGADFLSDMSQINQEIAALQYDNAWREQPQDSSSSTEVIEEESSSQDNDQPQGTASTNQNGAAAGQDGAAAMQDGANAVHPQAQNETSLQFFTMRSGDTPQAEAGQQSQATNKSPIVGDMREDDVSPNATSEEVPVNYDTKEEAEQFIFNEVIKNLTPPLVGRPNIAARINKAGLTVAEMREHLNRRIKKLNECQEAGMQETQVFAEKAKISFLTQAYLRNFLRYKKKTEIGKSLNGLIKEINREYKELTARYTEEEKRKALEREFLTIQHLTKVHPSAKLLSRREDDYLRSEPGLPLNTFEDYRLAYDTKETNARCQMWHWRPIRRLTADFTTSSTEFLKNWED